MQWFSVYWTPATLCISDDAMNLWWSMYGLFEYKIYSYVYFSNYLKTDTYLNLSLRFQSVFYIFIYLFIYLCNYLWIFNGLFCNIF
jgi:hypothetical protein